MKRIYLLMWVPCLGLFAACGDDESDPGKNLEAACEAYCEASLSEPCGQITLEQCKAACPLLEEQLEQTFGGCVSEYAALFDCGSELEFTCMNGQPIPTGTGCVSEAQALATCIDEASENRECKAYCKALADGGCAGGTESACVDKCVADTGGDCGYTLEDYYRCVTSFSGESVCDGATPRKPTECRRDYIDFLACNGQQDQCATHCAIVNDFDGCASANCESDCAMKIDTSQPCYSEYERLIECGDEYGWTCGTEPTADGPSCSYDQEQYDNCLMPQQ
jgi:hypothetical protein